MILWIFISSLILAFIGYAENEISKIINKNVYCVVHHIINKKPFEFTSNRIIYSPENIEREFPTTCALLVIYLNYVFISVSLISIKYLRSVNAVYFIRQFLDSL